MQLNSHFHHSSSPAKPQITQTRPRMKSTESDQNEEICEKKTMESRAFLSREPGVINKRGKKGKYKRQFKCCV